MWLCACCYNAAVILQQSPRCCNLVICIGFQKLTLLRYVGKASQDRTIGCLLAQPTCSVSQRTCIGSMAESLQPTVSEQLHQICRPCRITHDTSCTQTNCRQWYAVCMTSEVYSGLIPMPPAMHSDYSPRGHVPWSHQPAALTAQHLKAMRSNLSVC